MHSIIFHILLVLAMAALSWAAPARAKKAVTSLDDPTLLRLNRKAGVYASIGLFVWTPLCAWALGLVFYTLAEWNFNQFGDTPYRIVPTLIHWCIVAAFFAGAWSRAPMEGTVRFFLGQEGVDALNITAERQYNYGVDPAWALLRKILIGLGFVAFVFIADFGIFILPNQLIFNDLKSLFQKQAISFDQVSSIEFAPGHLNRNMSITPEPVYILRLSDQTEWKSNFNDFDKVAPVMVYLSNQSGIGIDTVKYWQ